MRQLSINEHLRTFDDGGSERPIRRHIVFLPPKYRLALRLKKGKPPPISLCLTMIWSTVFA
jgi:hypothetical protein